MHPIDPEPSEHDLKGGVLLKKYAGYIVAGAGLLFTAIITFFAKQYGDLLDAFFPYFSRTIQKILSTISAPFPFLLWQALVVGLILLLLVSLILVILRKRSFIRWLGWVLATASLLWTFHTGIHGLNFYASPLAEDLRMDMKQITQEDLTQALIYFRDQANALAESLPRDADGNLLYDDFDMLAENASSGYEFLQKSKGYSVFAGDTSPVKKLGWKKMYTAMGICGVTMAVTGEAAVNPDIPNMSIPFVMCHEMAHRMAIASEDDANFAAFLACQANADPQFQYSAYYMAYRYCINALGGESASRIHKEANSLFRRDLRFYDEFFNQNQSQTATNVANAANNTYIQASGDKNGVKSYNMVVTQLVNWYLLETAQPDNAPEFDPTDKDYINGIIGE